MKYRKLRVRPSHDRWLVSYADFITLLFAFFVVMLASSHADRSRAKRTSEAVQAAFEGKDRYVPPKAMSLPATKETAQRRIVSRELEPELNQLLLDLEPEIHAGKMQVRLESRGLVVSLSEASFFPSGTDSLAPSSLDSLAKVASAVRSVPNQIRAEGHTDSVPIHTARFRNNWDLSAARAIAIMELLRSKWGISPERLAVTGYAETAPLESNDTEAGRARNRRVDIVILNSSAAE